MVFFGDCESGSVAPLGVDGTARMEAARCWRVGLCGAACVRSWVRSVCVIGSDPAGSGVFATRLTEN